MNLNIKGNHLEVTPAIREFIEEKMKKIESKILRFGDATQCEMEVSKTTNHHQKGDIFRAEIHVRLPKHLVYFDVNQDDLYKAINMAIHGAERQIVDYKEEMV